MTLLPVFLNLIGNMDPNYGDMMELVWVFLTLMVSLVIIVLLGRWWQR